MPGSGAGLNRVGNVGGVVLLTLNPTSTAVATPLTGYGTAGNDSWVGTAPLTGAALLGSNAMVEATGFTKWQFQLVPPPGGTTVGTYQVTLYGTTSSLAYSQWELSHNPQAYAYPNSAPPAMPAAGWFILPGPSDQGGTGTDANPLTAAAPTLTVSRPLVAVRAVLTGGATPFAGNAQVIGFAVP